MMWHEQGNRPRIETCLMWFGTCKSSQMCIHKQDEIEMAATVAGALDGVKWRC